MPRTFKSDSNCVVPCCPLKLPEAVDCRLPNDNEVAERERGWRRGGFSRFRALKNAKIAREVASVPITAVPPTSFYRFPLSPLARQVFFAEGQNANGRTGAVKGSFLPSFLSFVTRLKCHSLVIRPTDLIHFPSSVRPDFAFSVSLRRSLPLEIL